jgi:phosphohistidine phosphatase
MRQAVRGFQSLDPAIDLILTSPFVRARKTADILVAGLSPTPDLEVLDALTPGHDPGDVAARISGHGGRRVIALVGHEPDLGVLAAWLIGAHEPLVFRKGGIARIDVASFPPGSDGQLVWLATPKMLRALAKDR